LGGFLFNFGRLTLRRLAPFQLPFWHFSAFLATEPSNQLGGA
jgi:hypothetical protein